MRIEARQHHISRPHRWLAVVGIVIALLASGCDGPASAPTKMVSQQQGVGPLTIALETPERLPLLTEQAVVVTLTDQDGQPVDSAEVWLALIMPTMPMRPNEPDAAPAGNGRYRATAIFTMAGAWNLEVHATVHGREHIALFHAQTS